MYLYLFKNIAGKPINTTLNLQPKLPFVGDNITLTCLSTIQRWPEGYGTSHLSYQFHGNTRGATANNELTINTLTMSDKGTIIKCQATDDQGKVSNMSRTVTLDPYCKYYSQFVPEGIISSVGSSDMLYNNLFINVKAKILQLPQNKILTFD